MANIPGIATSALIMNEKDWPSFERLCPDPVIWKENIKIVVGSFGPSKQTRGSSWTSNAINMETAFSAFKWVRGPYIYSESSLLGLKLHNDTHRESLSRSLLPG